MRLIQTVQVPAKSAEEYVFSGEATPFPGTPDLVVSHGVYSHSGPGTGAGALANDVRLDQLEDLGYSAVMATVDEANVRQIAILDKQGWKHVGQFHSRRTSHNVLIYMKDLT